MITCKVCKAEGCEGCVHDPIRPSHYTALSPEPIAVINAWGLNFNLGNTVKCIARAGKKDASRLIEDLEKAKFYLEWEISRLKGEHVTPVSKVPEH